MKDLIKQKNNGRKSANLSPTCTSDGIVTEGQICYYRNVRDSNACAAGCFIPDHAYKRDFEGQTISCLMRQSRDIYMTMPLDEIGMNELQRAHDSCLGGDMREVLFRWIDENVLD